MQWQPEYTSTTNTNTRPPSLCQHRPELPLAKIREMRQRSPRLGQLVQSMLQPYVKARLSAKEVLEVLETEWPELKRLIIHVCNKCTRSRLSRVHA